MTCVNGIMKGYWYQDGYIRTTSSEYSLSTNCSKIHLTNDSVQKNTSDYGKYEKGNKISYQDFQKYLNQIKTKKDAELYNFNQSILPRMKEIGR